MAELLHQCIETHTRPNPCAHFGNLCNGFPLLQFAQTLVGQILRLLLVAFKRSVISMFLGVLGARASWNRKDPSRTSKPFFEASSRSCSIHCKTRRTAGSIFLQELVRFFSDGKTVKLSATSADCRHVNLREKLKLDCCFAPVVGLLTRPSSTVPELTLLRTTKREQAHRARRDTPRFAPTYGPPWPA